MKVRPINNPDRSIDLQAGLDDIMSNATARLNQAGFTTTEVLTAWDEVLNNRWKILQEDPDPSDGYADELDWKRRCFN